MLRFYYVIIVSIPFIIYYLALMTYIIRHEDRYTEEQRYKVALSLLHRLKKNGRISTITYGQEKLPDENGYIMFPNHQGKYDAVGIMTSHEKPCTIVVEEKASHQLILSQFIDLIRGVRLDRSDMRKQMKSIQHISKEVQAGRRYIIFPEGGYEDNHNTMREFLPGAFKAATMSKAPIVPVAIYDTYKPFSINSIRKVRTQVSFLEPIRYEEYYGMTTRDIAELVKTRIANELAILQEKEREYAKKIPNVAG